MDTFSQSISPVSDTAAPAVSSAQVALLAALAQPMSVEDATALRQLVGRYFADKLREEMLRLESIQPLTVEQMDALADEHNRIPYSHP